jgi:hypothetical protein
MKLAELQKMKPAEIVKHYFPDVRFTELEIRRIWKFLKPVIENAR